MALDRSHQALVRVAMAKIVLAHRGRRAYALGAICHRGVFAFAYRVFGFARAKRPMTSLTTAKGYRGFGKSSGIRSVLLLPGADLHKLLDIVVDRENQQTSGRAKYRAGDAMMSVPAAILVLNLQQPPAHVVIPLLPAFILVDYHAFTGLQITDEFFSTVISKTAHHIVALGFNLCRLIHFVGCGILQ